MSPRYSAAFPIAVAWGGTSFGFSEISGLPPRNALNEYRDGAHFENSSAKTAALRKFPNITCKRGVILRDNDFARWLATVNLDKVERRDLLVTLFNEERKPVMTWKVRNAFPVKVEGPQLKAGANEIAIET